MPGPKSTLTSAVTRSAARPERADVARAHGASSAEQAPTQPPPGRARATCADEGSVSTARAAVSGKAERRPNADEARARVAAQPRSGAPGGRRMRSAASPRRGRCVAPGRGAAASAQQQGAVTQTQRGVSSTLSQRSGYRRRTCACAVLRGLGARSDASGARPAAGARLCMLPRGAFRLPARREGRGDAARHAARCTTGHTHTERSGAAVRPPRHAARPATNAAAILNGSRQAGRGACAGSRAAAACCSRRARRARRAEGKGGEASGCKGGGAAGCRTQPLCCCRRCCRARRRLRG